MSRLTRDRYFPKRVLLAAQHSQRAHGVPACVTLAQWALESAYGCYLSGTHNPFGIKAYGDTPGRRQRTWEVVNGEKVVTWAKFRNFTSLEDAFNHHGHMLMRPDGYYTAAHPHTDDWEAFIWAIAPTYATDPAYAAKLIAMVRRWHLYDFNLPSKGAPMSLEEYFRKNLERNACDHRLRAQLDSDGGVVFYVHPEGVDGDTLDYAVSGDTLTAIK